LGEWAVENGIKIDPGKSKAVSFTKLGWRNEYGIILGIN